MENQNKNKKKYLTKKRKMRMFKRKAIILLILIGLSVGTIGIQAQKLNKSIEVLAESSNPVKIEKKKSIKVFEVKSETIREVTAYNVGDVNQTDSSPCTGAYSKVDLCEEVAKGVKVCAANFVPLGTRLQITSGSGWSFECIVWDRMASKHGQRVDIAMNLWEKDRAIKFGLQKLNVRILGEETTISK